MSSTMLLDRHGIRVRWALGADSVAEDAGRPWFGQLDEILNDLDPDAPLGDERSETWHILADADMIVATDMSFGTGLDTWDF